MWDDPEFDSYGLSQWHWIARHKENLKIGKRVQIGTFSLLGCENGIEIEDDVKIGYHCVLITNSTVDDKKGKIILKDNCKIGANSVIMPGVVIGENSVIGACSFVNKNIPPNEVWFGCPAKFQRKLKEGENKKND